MNSFIVDGQEYQQYNILVDQDGEEFAVPTEEWKKEKERIMSTFLIREAGLGEVPTFGFDTYKGKDDPKNMPKLKKYVAEFKTNYSHTSVYLWSKDNSTQKTTIAKDILLKLLVQGVCCRFVLMNDLLNHLTQEQFSEASRTKVQDWTDCSFLVIDDCFDKNKTTRYASGYQDAFLDTFLRKRLEVFSRATCFTSNSCVDAIDTVWGESIKRLILRSTVQMEFNDILTDADFKVVDIWGGV